MKTYKVYETASTWPTFRKIGIVKANTPESARRKAIIGTGKKYVDTYACSYDEKKTRRVYVT